MRKNAKLLCAICRELEEDAKALSGAIDIILPYMPLSVRGSAKISRSQITAHALTAEYTRQMLERDLTVPDREAYLLGLLDRARNWVQDAELRAEITAVAPPKPRTKEDM